MALLMPGWLKGVPRMLSSLLGRAPRGKRGCAVRQLLARFLPPPCSVRKFIVAGMNSQTQFLHSGYANSQPQ